jgi:protein phosphatase
VVLRALTGRDTRFSLASFEVGERDRLLLCSDGICGVLADEVLAEVLAESVLEVCAELLVPLALRAGSRDNLTCIVAEIVVGESPSDPTFAGAAAGSSATTV